MPAAVTPYQKSITASVLLGLAVMQLVVISMARGWIGGSRPPARRRMARWHRLEGYIGIAMILVVAFFCLRLAPESDKTPRVYIHALLGVTVISLVLFKVAIMRFFPRHYSRMPLLGAALFAAIIAIWISSAGWYFVTQPGGY